MNRRSILVLLPFAAFASVDASAQQSDMQQDSNDIIREHTETVIVDGESEMRTAEAQLAEAARRVAELSTRRLPRMAGHRFAFDFSDRPMLGITIDDESTSGPVEGVRVSGITPGGAAAEAGLRAGDTITAVNKESMSADNSATANQKLLDFMSAVQEGDELDVEYLRNGKVTAVEITPQAGLARNFAYRVPGPGMQMPLAPMAPFAPRAPGMSEFVFLRGDGGWGDMEMVTLTKNLGRYFGTDKGLLVVRAPTDKDLKLMDGDVLQAIDGREPKSVSHAVRILGSYQAGETLEIDIMRNKRRETLKVEMPDNRQGAITTVPDPAAVTREAPVVGVREPAEVH